MTSKKFIVALAFLLGTTAASLAMGSSHSTSGYHNDGSYTSAGYDPDVITQR